MDHDPLFEIEPAAAEIPPAPEPDPEPGDDMLQAALDDSAAREQALLARLRDAILASDPALPPDLVHGATLEELEANTALARAAVRRIRAALAVEAPAVPAGAPGRAAPVAASPWEKIRAGIARL
ncbi:MAG: hypothetical protein IT302_09390 [Dehalococcoidia bacterium]|nr:hypothetical protein [Dehalococcoidia bacterium]